MKSHQKAGFLRPRSSAKITVTKEKEKKKKKERGKAMVALLVFIIATLENQDL